MPNRKDRGENSPDGGPKPPRATGACYPRPGPPARIGGSKWGPLWAWAVCLVCCPVIISVVYPVWLSARAVAPKVIAMSNAKQVALAVIMYANDDDDRFPPELSSRVSRDLLGPYLHDNQALMSAETAYYWNNELEGLDSTTVYNPTDTWLLRTILPVQDDSYVVAFVDGHVKTFVERDLQKMLGFSHDLTQLGADVHQVWRLPKEQPTEPTRQIDLTKPGQYTATINGPAAGGKGSVLYVIRGPYDAVNNQFWVGKGTSLEVYDKTRAGAAWAKVANNFPGVNRTDELNDLKAISVDLLKDGKPVTGKDIVRPPGNHGAPAGIKLLRGVSK
jgi:hypothetical protein